MEVLTCRGDQLNRFYCTCLTCRGNELNRFACPVVMSKLALLSSVLDLDLCKSAKAVSSLVNRSDY